MDKSKLFFLLFYGFWVYPTPSNVTQLETMSHLHFHKTRMWTCGSLTQFDTQQLYVSMWYASWGLILMSDKPEILISFRFHGYAMCARSYLRSFFALLRWNRQSAVTVLVELMSHNIPHFQGYIRLLGSRSAFVCEYSTVLGISTVHEWVSVLYNSLLYTY